MHILKRLADNTDKNSLAQKFRRKRFAFFRSLLETVPKPVHILDVGGMVQFWEQMGVADNPNIQITVLNLFPLDVHNSNIKSVVGDGCAMPQFRNKEFDIVFSNSVIEHVPDSERQRRMAQEIERVGTRYFVQTPNYYFPIEPHFLCPCFQFLPVFLKIFLLQHFSLGWFGKIPDREKAKQAVQEIRLLTREELCKFFPNTNIYAEKFLGLNKSFVAYAGFLGAPASSRHI